MFIDDCIDCTIVCGPCDGSIFIRTCTNCTVYIVSKQIRFRSCENVRVYTYCPSDPALESSVNVTFAPFNYMFPNLKQLFNDASFEQTDNKFRTVYDFSEQENPDQVHFTILPDDKFKIESLDSGIANGGNEHLYDGYPEYLATLFFNEQIKNEILQSSTGTSTTTTTKITSPQQLPTPIQEKITINTNIQDNQHDINIRPIDLNKVDIIDSKRMSLDNIVINTEPNDDINNVLWQENISINQYFDNQDDIKKIASSKNVSNSVNNVNTTTEPIHMNNIHISMDVALDDDEKEALRQSHLYNQRRMEKIRKKMELELELKKENINKANNYLEKWITTHLEELEKKKNRYAEEEKIFLEGRKASKISDNPWDNVVKSIDLKDSDYKGTKDITRMRNVIITRRGDIAKKLGKK